LLVPRCVTCDGTLSKTETSCLTCGTEVDKNPNRVTLQERVCSWLKVALILSSVMTVASIFTDFTPSFTKCSVATLILGLTKSSAEQMAQRH
jgi:hypothetical protein